MPIRKKRGKKNTYVLTSPKTGKVLATGSRAYCVKRARAIAYFRSR